jgi:hypothetical protein
MSILGRLFTRTRRPARCAIAIGDGQFEVYVFSNAQQRLELERLCGMSSEDNPRFPALLIPQPTNSRGRDTVAVRIGNANVGYLHHTTAAEFLEALRTYEFDRAACGARILIRPEPQLGDHAFRVRLDAVVPFNLVDPVNQTASDHGQAKRAG